ncbi:bath-40, partial [Symbiodinium natans]
MPSANLHHNISNNLCTILMVALEPFADSSHYNLQDFKTYIELLDPVESHGSEDNLRSLKQEGEDLSKIVDEVGSDEKQVEEEMTAMTKKIQELDQQMEESRLQRQDENKEYKQAIADSVRACDLLQRAKDRLSRFYTSTAAKAKAKVALLAQRRLRLRKIAAASRAIEAA